MKIRHFFRKIRQMIRWLPILWKDEDWDSAYLFEIMRFKIKCISEESQRINRHKSVDLDAHNMKITCELLHRFAFYEKPDLKNELCTCDPDACWTKEVSGKPHVMQWVNCFCIYCQRQHKIDANQEEENWKLLWKYMEKYSRSWWN